MKYIRYTCGNFIKKAGPAIFWLLKLILALAKDIYPFILIFLGVVSLIFSYNLLCTLWSGAPIIFLSVLFLAVLLEVCSENTER